LNRSRLYSPILTNQIRMRLGATISSAVAFPAKRDVRRLKDSIDAGADADPRRVFARTEAETGLRIDAMTPLMPGVTERTRTLPSRRSTATRISLSDGAESAGGGGLLPAAP